MMAAAKVSLKDFNNDNRISLPSPKHKPPEEFNKTDGHFFKTMLKEMEDRVNTNSESNDEFFDAEEYIQHSRESSISSSSLKKFVCNDRSNLDKGRLSDSLHSYSFAPSPTRHHVSSVSPSPLKDASLNSSWKFYNFVGVDENEAGFNYGNFNGNSRKSIEAVLTINARTSHILVVNQTACRLFNYKEEELCGKKIYELFTMEDGIKQEILIERNIDTDGNIVMASGKILEGVDSDGNVFIVSVWMKRIKSGDDARCVVIMEPVDVTKGSFLFDSEGMVKDCDFQFSLLHGYEDPQEIVGTHIHRYIPALMLPTPGHEIEKNIRKQRATSRTKDSVPFPSTIKIKIHDPEFHELYMERTNPSQVHHSKLLYKGFIWVFANVSGLATVTTDGLITSCNSNFLRTFLGYTEAELLEKSITAVIPYFYEQIELLCEESLPSQTPCGENTPSGFHRKGAEYLSSDEYESPAHGPLTHNDLLTVDEYVNVNSSGSTLSDGNSLQSASTLEECEILSDDKPTSVDSGFGSRNIIATHDDDDIKAFTPSLATSSYCKESEQGVLLSYEEPFENDLIDHETIELDTALKASNRKSRTDSGCNTETPNTETPTLISDRCRSEATGLDNFSTHLQSSTPKGKGRSELSFQDIMAEKNNKEIPLYLKRQVWASESAPNSDILPNDSNNNKKISDSSSSSDSNASQKSVIRSRDSNNNNTSGSTRKENELKLNTDTTDFTEYAIRTSEYGSLGSYGSPLSELELNNNEIGDSDVFSADQQNIHKNITNLQQSERLEMSSKDTSRSKKSNSNSSKELKELQIDNFMREMSLNDKTSSLKHESPNLELSPKKENKSKIVQGFYYGQAKHKDGSLLPVLFEIKKIYLKNKEEVFCIWISKDPDEDCEYTRKPETRSLLSSLNSTINTSTGNCNELVNSMKDLNVEDPGRGLYNERFLNVRCVGKGAFGFVNLAEKKANREQVIVKFIRKEKVLKDSWVNDDVVGRIPFEVYLLAQIQHPYIVKMLEAYENEDYFQMVMEKHGDGIDLFEFIDRKPQMDEALASYMYRQVLAATEYLHSEKILHRDIKDENIIVDRQFNIKLIDFGSAIYMEEGKLFNTFCGTVEYCSPEVLLGNWYEGPELEMWSLGVTLYTFIFGEHPFFEVEETIQAELFPPFKVSNELMFVVCWMLNPDVNSRARLKDLLTYPWFTRHVDIKKYDYDTVLGLNEETNSEVAPPPSDRSTDDLKKHARERQLSGEEYLNCTKCSSSSSSLSSSSSNTSLSEDEDEDANSQNELIRDKYKSFLSDPLDLRTDDILSKSF